VVGFDRKPDPVVGSPHWQERTAQAVHLLFYIVILGMIASGVGMMVLSGAASMIFGGEAALLPDFWKYPPRLPHGISFCCAAALRARAFASARPDRARRRWNAWPPARSILSRSISSCPMAMVLLLAARLGHDRRCPSSW
jgi:hypothetical protein